MIDSELRRKNETAFEENPKAVSPIVTGGDGNRSIRPVRSGLFDRSYTCKSPQNTTCIAGWKSAPRIAGPKKIISR